MRYWSIKPVVTTAARLILAKTETSLFGPGLAGDFSIGDLSRLTQCNIETIRYYERIGILNKPRRTDGGRRIYNQNEMKRLLFVRRSRQLGFKLNEVRELLHLVDGEQYTCAEVERITIDHADEVRKKIKDLKKIEQVLRSMAAKCKGKNIPDCPVIDVLFNTD